MGKGREPTPAVNPHPPGGEDEVELPDASETELEQIRKRLSQLVEQRRLVGLDDGAQAEYDGLVAREQELLGPAPAARQQAAPNHSG